MMLLLEFLLHRSTIWLLYKMEKEMEMEDCDREPISGGSHTAPETRSLLALIALLTGSRDVLETGYDAGGTTEILCMTGANVTAIDNLSEYPEVNERAKKKLSGYDNCTLIEGDALEFLRSAHDESYDLVFIDDKHDLLHVAEEAKELHRVLRPGGVATFHDTKFHGIWHVMQSVFPKWNKMEFVSMSPILNVDLGFGIAIKPKVLP